MKVLLPVALFLVVITVEGNLRGEHSHGDHLPRSLKKCMNMMGGPPCPPSMPPTPTDPDLGRDPEPTGQFDTCGVTIYHGAKNVTPCFQVSDCDNYNPLFGTACCLSSRCICGSDADAGGCANFAPLAVTVPTVDVPDLGRIPDPTRPFETCGVTSYQGAKNVTPCFQASDCDNYDPLFGTACCLSTRCICGSDADAGGCANFAPLLRTGPGVTIGPNVTVPTVDGPDLGRVPEPTGQFDTCGVTRYQDAKNVKPCFQASDCDNYKPKFGTACCLSIRCICGSDADAGGCANFDPLLRIGPGVAIGPDVAIPTVDVPPIPISPPTSGPTSPPTS